MLNSVKCFGLCDFCTIPFIYQVGCVVRCEVGQLSMYEDSVGKIFHDCNGTNMF